MMQWKWTSFTRELYYITITCVKLFYKATIIPPGLLRSFALIKTALISLGLVVLSGVSTFAQDTAGQADIEASIEADVRAERFDDWTLRCVVQRQKSSETPSAPPACEIAQPLMVEQDGKPVEVLNLAVSRASDKAGKADWAMVVLTPLDVQLASDFGFAAGSAKPSLLRYRNCNHLGCFVIVPLDRGRIVQLKNAAEGAAFFRLLTGQAVRVTFSLKGFTTAFDALASGALPSGITQKRDEAGAISKKDEAGN